jgi:beta-1,4-N-acetylglucosaminyltransferase
VPNTGLLDNHQEELAVAMERNNYLVRGDVTYVHSLILVVLSANQSRNLAPAIKKSDDFRLKMSQFPPVTSGKHRETKSFAAIMDETTGYMD